MSKYVKFLHANFAISTVVVVEQMAELFLPLPVNLVLQFSRKNILLQRTTKKTKIEKERLADSHLINSLSS